MEETVTITIGTLVAVITAVGGLRGYDMWMARRKSGDSSNPDNNALMAAIGRNQEQHIEIVEILRRIEEGLSRGRDLLREIDKSVAVLEDRSDRK